MVDVNHPEVDMYDILVDDNDLTEYFEWLISDRRQREKFYRDVIHDKKAENARLRNEVEKSKQALSIVVRMAAALEQTNE